MMKTILVIIAFSATLNVAFGQAGSGGAPPAPQTEGTPFKPGQQVQSKAEINPAAPTSGSNVAGHPGAPSGAAGPANPMPRPVNDQAAEPSTANPADISNQDFVPVNFTGAPHCWLCSDYNLDDVEDGNDGGDGHQHNGALTTRRKRSSSEENGLNVCKPYDPSDPHAVYGTLVPKLEGFKCFVFHENNRTGKVVMRGMLPLDDLKLFKLEENGCKDDVANGEIVENVTFFACACETDKCNANSAPLFRPTVTMFFMLALAILLI